MKPLIFLTTRSIFNGIKRAVTTPRRLITIILVIGYYFYFFVRPGLTNRRPLFSTGFNMDLPPMAVLEALVFALFVGLSLLLMLTIFSQVGGFKQPDVDMLFPTPVSHRLVLAFRIVRDYVTTLFLPILFGLFAIVPIAHAWTALFKKMPHPETGELTARAIGVAWVLMAFVWVAITYALNLSINRSDLQSDRNKKILVWSAVSAVALVVAYAFVSLTTITDGHEAVELAHSPVLRVFFFTATFATQMVMAPLKGDWTMGIVGAASMLALVALAMKVAVSQSGWMYDQAAVKGFGSHERRQLQQKGDFYGMVASMAREGKLKAGRRTWLHRLRLQGPVALLWKDIFLQTRGMKFLMLMLLAMALFLNLTPALAVSSSKRGTLVQAGLAFLGMQLVTLLMMTVSYAQTGFLELLRRVDTQKPLPFSPATTVLMEILSKSLIGTLGGWGSSIVLVVVRPALWPFAVAAVLIAPFISMLISSAALLLTLLFPDIDDASQRPIRGVLMMLSIVIFAIPGAMIAGGGFAAASALGVSTPMAVLMLALPVSAVNLGITVLVSSFAGNLYANYNPSE